MAKTQVSKKIRDELLLQALNEIEVARKHKKGRMKNWESNENMYYMRKKARSDSRSNVNLNKMHGYVRTILSKIDTPLDFKYLQGSEEDRKKARLLNALKDKDKSPEHGNWAMKDFLGKTQGVIYGRAIYEYHASSVNGYRSHLENVDAYNFLIDPSAGGVDIEKARYMGRAGIRKSKYELEQGKKSGLYLVRETNALIATDAKGASTSEEEQAQENRYASLGNEVSSKYIESADDRYRFWEWYTTRDGKRYYMLLSEDFNTVIRVEELTNVFESNLWPFWTWAAFPDLAEFWTPSYCDVVRELFMAQDVSINQMLDNAEQINKPQKAVDVSAIKNLKELKYKKNGIIRFTAGTNLNSAMKIVETPAIKTPIEVYNILEGIQQSESGVTAGAKGTAEEDKVGIYEGNQAAAADRFGLLDASYSNGYHRFAVLYKNGVYEHLRKAEAVEILGPNGIEYSEITRKDIKPRKRDFSVSVQASDAETRLDTIEKRDRLKFLSSYVGNESLNQAVLFEAQAEIAGLDQTLIKRLQDVNNESDADLMSEAARDISRMLDKEVISEPNPMANTAYMQKIVDYMRDNKEHMNVDQFRLMDDYVQRLRPVVISNMGKQITQSLAKEGALLMGQADGPAQLQDVNQVANEQTNLQSQTV